MVILRNVHNSLDLTSGGSIGFTIGAFVTPHVELEFSGGITLRFGGR